MIGINSTRKMRLAAGLKIEDVLERMRPDYPRMSKSALKAAEMPKLTGVMLTPRAKRLMAERLEQPVTPARRCPCHWSFRVTEAFSAELTACMTAEGFATKDAFLNHVVREYAKRKAAGASDDFSTQYKNPHAQDIEPVDFIIQPNSEVVK